MASMDDAAGKTERLLAHAQSLVDSGDPENAALFLRRAVEHDPSAPKIYDLLGEVEMSLGNEEEACRAWMRAIESSGDPNEPCNAERWMYLAQTQEGDASRQSYLQGIALLSARLGIQPAHADKSSEGNAEDTTKGKLCVAYCALAELYLTDLCFEDTAEQACQVQWDSVRKIGRA